LYPDTGHLPDESCSYVQGLVTQTGARNRTGSNRIERGVADEV